MTDRLDQMTLKFRDVLAATERLPPDKLRAYQHNLLRPLVQHARHQVPFYERRLDCLFRGADVDLSRWHEIPVLTRGEAQSHTQAMAANALPPHAGPVDRGETSGSTGRPLRYLINELANMASLGSSDRSLRWWDFDGSKTMATIVARNRSSPDAEGVTVTGWRAGSSGLHHMIPVSLDNSTQLDWLLAHRPHYLTAHSFMLAGLAEQALTRGLDLRFERIISTSMVLTDEIREACKSAFGVRPIDQYGSREIGLIACECPWCGHYHVNAESILVEILDAEGRPCLPGQTGRVVLTALYNYAMPFIRYEIGDFAVVGPQRLKCPVKLPALKRILGRYRNSFTLRDGRVIYPLIPVQRLRQFIAFAQFQIVQTDYETIEVRYVPAEPARPADAAGLEACVHELIDQSFSVQAVAVDEIARSASGKYEDYLSLVPQGGTAPSQRS